MESFSRTDGTTTNLNWRSDLLGFLHGRMPQRIPALELDKSFCFFSCFFFFFYQELLPTKVYHNRKTESQVTDKK